MHLRFDLRLAQESGLTAHPQSVMRDLGISYQIATPQRLADQWWFWNCESVPAVLPKYLSPMTVDPASLIGRGLSRGDAETINAGRRT